MKRPSGSGTDHPLSRHTTHAPACPRTLTRAPPRPLVLHHPRPVLTDRGQCPTCKAEREAGVFDEGDVAMDGDGNVVFAPDAGGERADAPSEDDSLPGDTG